jgi:diguanylate cyclase (GGDEF)-like protein
MTDGHQAPDPSEEASLPTAAMVARLAPYLNQSIMVLRRDWTVVADLAPPGGLLGRGLATGHHPFAAMHPDDAERVAAFAQEAMHSEPGWRGATDLRAQRADGTWGTYRIRVHNRFDDPVLEGMVVVSDELAEPGTGAPASTTVDAMATLSLEVVGDHLPVGLLLLDHLGDVAFANAAACELLGTHPDALRAGQPPEGLAPEVQDEVLAILHRLRAAPGRETLTAALGGDPPRLLSGTFVSRAGAGTGGAVQYVIITVEDVTHRHARERHLEHRANHDSLTGLPNRAWLLDHLDERLAAGARLDVAFVDLDGFKAVNDRLGHAAGDDLLAEIGEALRVAMVDGETVARVGGDEFVVVGDHHDPVERDDLRARIRKAVEGTTGAALHDVGVSVGITASEPGDQPWDLLGRADAAMYGDKRRNG